MAERVTSLPDDLPELPVPVPAAPAAPVAHAAPSENPPSHPDLLFASGTYVVQVPKDLIYRTPPPENALIVERHRNPLTDTNKRSRCCRCVCICASVTVIVVALGILAALLIPVFTSPKDPKFDINKIVVHNNTNSLQEFNIKLNVENSGSISFSEGGRASLLFGKQEIAAGKYPVFQKNDGSVRVVSLVLSAKPKAIFPKEMQKSLKSNESKVHVSLSLRIILPAQIKKTVFSGGRDVKLVVACGFVVDTLAKGSRILSQKCESFH